MTTPDGPTRLPQPGDGVYLTDGGIETSLIFDDGIDLPDFAAFVLLADDAGRDALRRYYRRYLDVAARDGVGIVLESATWRASSDWGTRLGYDDERLRELTRAAVELVADLRDEYPAVPVVVSGCVGPRGDGYVVDQVVTPDESQEYHQTQVSTMVEAGVDVVTAITMTTADEAIGVVRAAQACGAPSVISFTVELDGRLPSGEAIGDAITSVDAATAGGPTYYMVNCAHPSHFESALDPSAPWAPRLRGVRANASRMSHAELDEAEELDAGDSDELAQDYRRLRGSFPHLDVLGGCCGTNEVHISAISRACAVGPGDRPAAPAG